MTRAAARRYLLTLQHLGYVESDGKLFLAYAARLAAGMVVCRFRKRRADRAAVPAADHFGLRRRSPYFAVRDGDDVVFVARAGNRLVQNVGFMLGAGCRRICFGGDRHARLLAAERGRALAVRPGFPAFHAVHTVTTVDGVRELIATARSRGYAVLEQQLDPGMRGIAVPIRNRASEVVGAISVSLAMGNESTRGATSRVLPVLREVEHSLLALL